MEDAWLSRRQPVFGARSVDPVKMAVIRSPIPRKTPDGRFGN